jgi:ribosomal protein S18 acetylase RimI-like enzyme
MDGATRAPRSVIRAASPADHPAVLELWRAAGALPTVTDRADALRVLWQTDAEALLVAACGERVVGSVIAAWNGWRGSLFRLAVHPEHRRRSIATQLVREGERRLVQRGARRIDAIVLAGDAAAIGFWRSVGYEVQAERSRLVRNIELAAD